MIRLARSCLALKLTSFDREERVADGIHKRGRAKRDILTKKVALEWGVIVMSTRDRSHPLSQALAAGVLVATALAAAPAASAGSDLAIPCTNSVDEVYRTRVPLFPAFVPPGTILRCAPLPPLSKEEIAAALTPIVPGLVVKSGVSQFLVSYRTQFAPGFPAVSTAVIALPDQPLPGPQPMIVGGHGLNGIADTCAVSKISGVKMTTHSWASVGYPSIVPDYAGLGTVDTQPVQSTVATASSLLDGARALRHAVAPEMLDGRVALVGVSQGADGILVAQGLARTYAPELNLAAAVAMAGIYLEPLNPLERARTPDYPIDTGEGAARAITAAGVYGTIDAIAGRGVARTVFQPEIRLFTQTMLNRLCGVEAFPVLACEPPYGLLCRLFGYTPPNTLGEMFAPEILQTTVACLDGTDGCEPSIKKVIDLLELNKTPLDPQGADILWLAGTADVIVSPESAACSLKLLEDRFGIEPQACLSAQGHYDIASAQRVFAQKWIEATLAGESPPACPEALALPPCPQP